MIKEIKQKSAFKTLEFSIDDTGLLMRKKTKSSDIELHFTFEQIKTTRASETDHIKIVIVSAFIALGFAFLFFIISFSDKTIETSTIIFWTITSVALFVIYYATKSKKTYLYTTDNKLIDFYADKPSESVVSEFIENVIQDRNQYLLSKYGNPNRNLEYGPQLDNLNWLLNTKAISKASYDEKIKELNALFTNSPGSNPIGFAKSN